MFIEHLLYARHFADVLHLTFPREPQPAHQAVIRDHLVQSSHLTEEETEVQRGGVTHPQVSERQSPGCSLRLLTPCPGCSSLSLGPPGQGYSLSKASGTHGNEDSHFGRTP